LSTFWGLVGYAIYLCILVVLARFVFDTTRQFARSWRPAGVAAVAIEAVYVVTDPPIRAIRRLVPPVRIGSVSLDLSIMILLFGFLALHWVALTLA
jgi:YggT family protein